MAMVVSFFAAQLLLLVVLHPAGVNHFSGGSINVHVFVVKDLARVPSLKAVLESIPIDGVLELPLVPPHGLFDPIGVTVPRGNRNHQNVRVESHRPRSGKA